MTTEHWYMRLLKRAQKYKIVLSQSWDLSWVSLEMWNKLMFLDIPLLERHKDWNTLTQKLENVWSWLYVLSKALANFMILIISSFRNISRNKSLFFKFLENKLDIVFRSITWYWITWQCGKNLDLWQLIVLDILRIFFNVQWNMMTTKLSPMTFYTAF